MSINKKHKATNELKEAFLQIKPDLPKNWISVTLVSTFGKKADAILSEYHRLKNISSRKAAPSPSDLKKFEIVIKNATNSSVKTRLKKVGIKSSSQVTFGNSTDTQDSMNSECIKS
jgi:hypothetical protein